MARGGLLPVLSTCEVEIDIYQPAATTYRPGAASSYTVNIVNIDNVDMINEWY